MGGSIITYMTSTSRVVVHCTFCDRPYNYELPEEIPKNARIYCVDCKKQFRFKRQLSASQSNQNHDNKPGSINKEKGDKMGEGSSSPSTPSNTDSTHKPSKPPPPKMEEQRFIDDPDELLTSVAIRELNKPDPDPRWANILISCKKAKITTKGDDIESFRKLPNEVLANLLNKSRLKTS